MTSGNHLLNLINNVLDMSHIESGKMQLSEQLCSLPEILHLFALLARFACSSASSNIVFFSISRRVSSSMHSKQLELYMDAIDVQNERIYCDRLRLNQVLLNLLNNAINSKLRSHILLACHADGSIHHVYDVFRDCHAKPCALNAADGCQGKKRYCEPIRQLCARIFIPSILLTGCCRSLGIDFGIMPVIFIGYGMQAFPKL